MKVIIRADASALTGTGHVMRCLTLAEALTQRGHDVVLATAEIDVRWLAQNIKDLGLHVVPTIRDEINIDQLVSLQPDWVVVDSYRIPEQQISALAEVVPLLAFVDSDSREINASLYLDQNFGSEELDWPAYVIPRLLAGAAYSLVRDDVLRYKRAEPWILHNDVPRLLAVMGGSDPSGSIRDVARGLIALEIPFEATLVVSPEWQEEIKTIILDDKRFNMIAPTRQLGELYGAADVVVSAAGSSSWEVLTMGIPALLVAVVDNQQTALHLVDKAGLALCIDRVAKNASEFSSEFLAGITKLATNQDLREDQSRSATAVFDGQGKFRVVTAMEEFLLSHKPNALTE